MPFTQSLFLRHRLVKFMYYQAFVLGLFSTYELDDVAVHEIT